MKNNNKKHLSILKWGGILGAGLIVLKFIQGYAKLFDFYPIGPVIDLLLALLFIGALFMGIKEYRDSILEGTIKFPKAFLVGGLISGVAFFIMFIYLIIDYNYINKNALNELNKKNELRYIENTENKEVTDEDIKIYLKEIKPLLSSGYLKESNLNSTDDCLTLIEPVLQTITDYYIIRLQNKKLADSTALLLVNFDRYAQKVFLEIAETALKSQEVGSECNRLLNDVITSTVKEMQSNQLLKKKIDAEWESIPRYENIFATALYFSISVIIYGLLFSLFVALYLYRSKKESDNQEEEIENEENINIENEFQED